MHTLIGLGLLIGGFLSDISKEARVEDHIFRIHETMVEKMSWCAFGVFRQIEWVQNLNLGASSLGLLLNWSSKQERIITPSTAIFLAASIKTAVECRVEGEYS